MGSFKYIKAAKQGRQNTGKIDASPNKKLEEVTWGEYRLGELFESYNGNFDIKKEHINGNGEYVITAGITNNGILGKTDVTARIFDKNTITVDMFGCAFYRQFNYKIVTHARVFSLEAKFKITKNQGLFLANSLHFLNKKFGYQNMCSWEKVKYENIQLPTKNDKIDFEFMESFIAELEAQRIKELKAYLLASGLNDYILTGEEQNAIDKFTDGKVQWDIYNVKNLFGQSTRGKRLKSLDRISGKLPFVTAGEANEGISAFISNKVDVFLKNTSTIDMFGSAKYRNYDYGADDHIAVVHTEKLNKYAAIFVTTSLHKTSHSGQFDYSRNFYAKDADNLMISLPLKDKTPDYNFMQTLISAIQKLVIKDVVLYKDRVIGASKEVFQGKTIK